MIYIINLFLQQKFNDVHKQEPNYRTTLHYQETQIVDKQESILKGLTLFNGLGVKYPKNLRSIRSET